MHLYHKMIPRIRNERHLAIRKHGCHFCDVSFANTNICQRDSFRVVTFVDSKLVIIDCCSNRNNMFGVIDFLYLEILLFHLLFIIFIIFLYLLEIFCNCALYV